MVLGHVRGSSGRVKDHTNTSTLNCFNNCQKVGKIAHLMADMMKAEEHIVFGLYVDIVGRGRSRG